MRVLVFRLGFLGDTLVALPALWAVREHFGRARIDYLSEASSAPGHVPPEQVLPSQGLVDRFITFRSTRSHMFSLAFPALFLRVLRGRYHALVYLAPSRRSARQIRRDLLFFRCAGITQAFGVTGNTQCPDVSDYSQPVEHETDFLLRHLACQGIATPQNLAGRIELGLNREELSFPDPWMDGAGIPYPARPRLLAVGPGGKMPAKVWPMERYEHVVSELIRRHDVWPIVFGGGLDVDFGRRLIATWQRGTLAAGTLRVRQAAAVLGRCRGFLGNDTGTMHLAAAAGTRCVAVFSARDLPGRWDPYGHGHRIFRRRISCEGCMLEICNRGNECLREIGTDEVIEACSDVITGEVRPVRS
jgi:ADP-heptose:LPS heptosyltransferase